MLMHFHINQVRWVGSIICVSQMREQAAEIKYLMVIHSPGMRTNVVLSVLSYLLSS